MGAKVGHGSLGGWDVAALVVFVLCLASAIWVLLSQELTFAFRGEALLAVSDHEGVEDLTEAYRAAGDLDRAIPRQQPREDRETVDLVHSELRAAGSV